MPLHGICSVLIIILVFGVRRWVDVLSSFTLRPTTKCLTLALERRLRLVQILLPPGFLNWFDVISEEELPLREA